MEMQQRRAPRSYAGDKSASMEQFFADYGASLSEGDSSRDAKNTEAFAAIMSVARARNAMDLGGLMRASVITRKAALEAVGADNEYIVDGIEDVLDFNFYVPPPVEVNYANPVDSSDRTALVAPRPVCHGKIIKSTMQKIDKYGESNDPGLGATLFVTGQLDTIIVTLAMFADVVTSTSNPLLETITQKELEAINDRVWEGTFDQFGKGNVDMIYLEHLARQLHRDLLA